LPIADGQEFSTEGATLRAIHTPGHTSVRSLFSHSLCQRLDVQSLCCIAETSQDSMSFVLLEEGSVFVGDCILGAGSSVFSNLKQYLASLKHLRDRVHAFGGVVIILE
jgi:endoribonuclease LACTB2